jgi:hypothetical protein
MVTNRATKIIEVILRIDHFIINQDFRKIIDLIKLFKIEMTTSISKEDRVKIKLTIEVIKSIKMMIFKENGLKKEP